MTNNFKVIMLHSSRRVFYISSLELDDIKSLRTLDHRKIEAVTVQNDDFETVIDLEGVNILPATVKDYISIIEQGLSPKYIMAITLKLHDGIQLHFETGEFSIFSPDTVLIQNVAIELLNHFGFNGSALFKKLKSNKHFYISVSQSGEFEYLFPHP